MWKFILSFLLIALVIKESNSAVTAELQLLVAVPDPVQAGTVVNFQAIVANTGTEDWLPNEYIYEVEIYNIEKKFIAKTVQYTGTELVKPAGKVPLTAEFKIPPEYVGTYYFRFAFIHKGQKIIYSDYYSFYVSPIPVPILAPPPPTGLAGTVLASYRNESKNVWKNDHGTLSLLLNGRFQYQTLIMNMYTTHTREKPLYLYSIFLRLYTPRFNLGLGDVSPIFSPMTVFNTTARGGLFTTKLAKVNTAVLAGQLVTPQEGTSTTNGIYGRYLTSIKGSVTPAKTLTVSAVAAKAFDDKNSIKTPGPTLKPVDNTVASIETLFQPVKFFKLTGEYALSSYSSNVDDPTTRVSDSAYRVNMTAETEKFTTEVVYTVANPDFVSLGSPTIIKDRARIDTNLKYRPFKFTELAGTYSKFDDNIKKNPTKTVLSQDIIGGGIMFTYRNLRNLSLRYSLNTSVATPSTITNNKTETYNTGISYDLFSWMSIFSSFQRTEFKDLTKLSSDLQTDILNLSLKLVLFAKFSINLGNVISNAKDLKDGSINKTNSFSITGNLNFLPEKLNITFQETYLTNKNDKVSSSADNIKNDTELEVTYYPVKDLSITLGTGWEMFTDNLNRTKDYSQAKVNIRASIGF